jgi:hypothetical protein
MAFNPIFFMEFVLFSGLALAWGIWEYVRISREIARDKAAKAAFAAQSDEAGSALAGEARHAEGQKRA